MNLQLYPPNRRRLAQYMAEQIIRLEVRHTDYHRGTFNGLEVAATLQGFTTKQVGGIILTARQWAAIHCPGQLHNADTCPPDCPGDCRDITIDRRHWRNL